MARVRFDTFELDLATGDLRKEGRVVRLRPQPAKLLALLVERDNTLVTRDEIKKALWEEDTIVDFEYGINHCIKQLRKVLGDDSSRPRFVETVPRRGYRFVANVEHDGKERDRGTKAVPYPRVSVFSEKDAKSFFGREKALPRLVPWRAQDQDEAVPGVQLRRPAHFFKGTAPRFLYVALLGAAILGLGVLASTLSRTPAPELRVTRFEIETEPLRGSQRLSFSLDGTKLLYRVRGGQTYLRHMDRDRALPVEAGAQPVLSPHGKWIAFFKGKNLMKAPVEGGAVVTLCSTSGTLQTLFDWELEDRIVFTQKDGIYSVPASGGEPQRLEATSVESDVLNEVPRFADVLPGGNAILMTVGGWYVGAVAALHRIDTGERRVLIKNANAARYVPSGHVLFERDDTLYAVRFDLDRLTVEGEPVPVLENVYVSQVLTRMQYTTSDTGSLAYVPSRWDGFRRQLVWVDREGNVEPIRSFAARINGPRIAPDGERIALTIYEGSRPSVWLAEASRETLTPFLPDQWAFQPTWSPDGEKIAFTGHSPERLEIRPEETGRVLFVKSLQPDAEPELVASGFSGEWSMDGNALVYTTFGMDTLFDIWTIDLGADLTPTPYLTQPYEEVTPSFSPDGEWIAYSSCDYSNSSLEGEGCRVYIRRADGSGARYPISTEEGGVQPVWSPDGREIFYRAWKGEYMMAVQVQTDPVIKAASPRALFSVGEFTVHDANRMYRNFDISPDGRRFLMIQSEEEPPPPTRIKIVLNWFSELERLVPVK